MRHSRASIGAVQYSLRYPQLIAASPPLKACEQRGGSYVGVYLPKTAYILPFLVNTGRERQGQTLRLDVFIRSLRTGGGGEGWFRHETELEVALCLDHWEDHSWDSDMRSFYRGACESFSSWGYWSMMWWCLIMQWWIKQCWVRGDYIWEEVPL